MRRQLLVMGVLFTGPFVLAQNVQAPDSTVFAEGKILNAETREPVEARITYQSLPYGSKMGIINGSSYSFQLFDNDHYAITVTAQGYAPAKYLIDPAEANENHRVVKDIELSTQGPGGGQENAVGTVMRLTNLIFQQGKARISPESYPELDRLAGLLTSNRRLVIQLEGHTDYLGNADKNMKLSQDRVDAVREYLTKKGVSKSQVKTKAFGGTQPLSRDDTPEAHSMNRRVEVRILQN